MQNKLKNYLKIFRYSKYIILFNIIERLFSFIIFLSFARTYSVDLYGEIITAFTFATIIITLFDFGFPILLQREISISGKDSSETFDYILYLNVLILFVYIALILIFYWLFYSYISFKIVFFISIFVYIYSLINIFSASLSGINIFKKRFYYLLISRFLILMLFFPLLVLLKVNLIYLFILLSAGCVFQIYLMAIELKKYGLKFSIPVNFTKMINVLKLSIPLGLAVIFNFLYDKIDIVLISKLTDFSQVAYYNVGYGIYKASAIAFSFLLVSGFTRVSYLSRNKNAVKLFYRKYANILIVLSIILTIILFFGSGIIIKIIYTEKYLNSVLVLKILSFAIIGLSLNNLTGIILNALALFKQNMIVTLVGFVINIILNIVFIPLYGIIAAAVISILTEYIIFAGDYYYLKIYLK